MVAEVQRDSVAVARLRHEYADVLARAGTFEQRVRDDHGHMADVLEDFRPSAQSPDSQT
jgi:hypothetical protein